MMELSVLEVPRKRRRFTAAFKARIVEACQQPGASVDGVALEHSLNANLVHNWNHTTRHQPAVPEMPAFVPVPMTRDSSPATREHQIAALIEGESGIQALTHYRAAAFPSPRHDNAPTWRQDGALS